MANPVLYGRVEKIRATAESLRSQDSNAGKSIRGFLDSKQTSGLSAGEEASWRTQWYEKWVTNWAGRKA